MSADIWGVIRTVGLWVLIVCDALLLLTLGLTQEWVWLIFFGGITLWTIGFEIWGVAIGFPNKDGVWIKQTISNRYKDYIKRVGWIGYVALGLFLAAMFGLAGLHLPFWGGMFQ